MGLKPQFELYDIRLEYSLYGPFLAHNARCLYQNAIPAIPLDPDQL